MNMIKVNDFDKVWKSYVVHQKKIFKENKDDYISYSEYMESIEMSKEDVEQFINWCIEHKIYFNL